jgi:hypothetical protein
VLLEVVPEVELRVSVLVLVSLLLVSLIEVCVMLVNDELVFVTVLL